VGQGSLNIEAMFPELPPGNIYVALTGGIESTLLYYLVLENYSSERVYPITYQYGDRREWEYPNARKIAHLFGEGHKHKSAGIQLVFRRPEEDDRVAQKYFNRENGVFRQVRADDPHFVAGFTGKNTTTLDPECITPEEQEKYLEWYSIHRPFLMMDKVQTVGLYYELSLESLLKYTHSCQSHGDIHCGECHACNERVDAFDRLGKKDPAIYKKDYEDVVKDVRENFLKKWPRRPK
jgi:hypothetical protein